MYNIDTMSSREKNFQKDNKSTALDEAEKIALMKKLETEGEQKLKDLQTKKQLTVDSLSSIMESGFEEFKEKTGINPTYAEMRAMYG